MRFVDKVGAVGRSVSWVEARTARVVVPVRRPAAAEGVSCKFKFEVKGEAEIGRLGVGRGVDDILVGGGW